MTMTMQVAVPYWYYVKKLGRRIVRYSKIMAHDENNTANVSYCRSCDLIGLPIYELYNLQLVQ